MLQLALAQDIGDAERTGAVDAACILQTLEDITQEINYTLWELSGMGGDRFQRLETAAKIMGNDKVYNISELMKLHALNLNKLAEIVASFAEEPTEEQKEVLKKQQEEIGKRYIDHDPIINQYKREAHLAFPECVS